MNLSAIETQDQKLSQLGLSKMIVNEEQVCCYDRGLGSASEKNPVLVLIHGYPQSAFMWRHLIPLLPSESPLFVPDLPGYGASSPIKDNDKLTVGTTILSALQTQMKRSLVTSSSDVPIVLIGHDRGARVAHRLAVSGMQGFKILGACLIDIVPTTTQWSDNPRVMTGYFHWPFLANVDLARNMITAYGGDRWCTEMIQRWAGKNTNGLTNLYSHDSLALYSSFFTQPHTIESSNLDYLAGATTDIEQQKEDHEKGKKIPCPLLLVYSKDYIGSGFDVKKEWVDYVNEGVEITECALMDGIGHFGAEEAPEETGKAIRTWWIGLAGTN